MAYPGLSSGNPTDRDSFKQYILRQLGAPVIEINVSDEQVDDAVNNALSFFFDYHYDGSSPQYYKYQPTPTDKANGYITLPDNIIGAVSIFDTGGLFAVDSLFNVKYQFLMSDMWLMNSFELAPYYSSMTNLQQIQQILVGKQPIRYNRNDNKLYIDTDWNFIEGYLIVECYSVIDPDAYPRVWSERWLRSYGTAQVKKIWGNNLKKFSGMQMPGGITFNGQTIYNEAVEEIRMLERELMSLNPAIDMIG